MAAAQQPVLLPAAPFRKLPKAIERRGGAALSGIVCAGGFRGQKYPGGTKPAAGGPCDEEQVMHGKIFCGGQMGVRCLPMEIGLRKYIGKRCLTKIGQARQGFDACRAVSLCEGHGEKADAGFVDAQRSILTGRIFVAFRANYGMMKQRKVIL